MLSLGVKSYYFLKLWKKKMHGHLTAVVCYVIFSHMMKNRGQHGANNLDHFQQDIKTANKLLC